MADTRTNDRPVARSLWSFVGLIVALICLPFPIAFADSPLQGNHPVSAPGIDELLDDDRSLMGGQMLKQGRIPPRAMRPCISTAAQVRLLDLAPLVPVPTLCVGSTVSADVIGWGGYEAIGDHERSVGNWSEAEQAYVKAIELLERTAVKDHNQDLAGLLNKLGVTRYTQKDFAGAEAAYRKALRIYTSTQAAEDLRVADTLHVLAMVLFEQPHGRDLAGALFFRAWAVREKVLGPDHLAVAESLHRMALSLYRDDLSKAVPLLLQAMEIRERNHGHAHPSVAETLTAMAGLYEAHHRQDLAIPLYQTALTIQEQVFGPNATETMQVRNSLHMAHREKGSPNEDSKGQE
ncbi:MAG: tetratricopeptide repeat protein [Nitrospira sp.]|nr:tetratricopeptide repeat protein [Nitrospira sp.]